MNAGLARAIAVAAAAVIATAGCAPLSLELTRDTRLHFLTPTNGAVAQQPVTVTWTIRDFTVTGPDGAQDSHAGYFAVFLDRPPVQPGQTLRAVAGGDRGCIRTPSCPNAAYLADRHVYTTTAPHITIDNFPAPSHRHRPNRHYITVVLLDGSGRRIGDGAWQLTLDLPSRA